MFKVDQDQQLPNLPQPRTVDQSSRATTSGAGPRFNLIDTHGTVTMVAQSKGKGRKKPDDEEPYTEHPAKRPRGNRISTSNNNKRTSASAQAMKLNEPPLPSGSSTPKSQPKDIIDVDAVGEIVTRQPCSATVDGSFPRFTKGDVYIKNGPLKRHRYLLHSETLKRVSPWFAKSLASSITAQELDKRKAEIFSKETGIKKWYELHISDEFPDGRLVRLPLTYRKEQRIRPLPDSNLEEASRSLISPEKASSSIIRDPHQRIVQVDGPADEEDHRVRPQAGSNLADPRGFSPFTIPKQRESHHHSAKEKFEMDVRYASSRDGVRAQHTFDEAGASTTQAARNITRLGQQSRSTEYVPDSPVWGSSSMKRGPRNRDLENPANQATANNTIAKQASVGKNSNISNMRYMNSTEVSTGIKQEIKEESPDYVWTQSSSKVERISEMHRYDSASDHNIDREADVKGEQPLSTDEFRPLHYDAKVMLLIGAKSMKNSTTIKSIHLINAVSTQATIVAEPRKPQIKTEDDRTPSAGSCGPGFKTPSNPRPMAADLQYVKKMHEDDDHEKYEDALSSQEDPANFDANMLVNTEALDLEGLLEDETPNVGDRAITDADIHDLNKALLGHTPDEAIPDIMSGITDTNFAAVNEGPPSCADVMASHGSYFPFEAQQSAAQDETLEDADVALDADLEEVGSLAGSANIVIRDSSLNVSISQPTDNVHFDAMMIDQTDEPQNVPDSNTEIVQECTDIASPELAVSTSIAQTHPNEDAAMANVDLAEVGQMTEEVQRDEIEAKDPQHIPNTGTKSDAKINATTFIDHVEENEKAKPEAAKPSERMEGGVVAVNEDSIMHNAVHVNDEKSTTARLIEHTKDVPMKDGESETSRNVVEPETHTGDQLIRSSTPWAVTSQSEIGFATHRMDKDTEIASLPAKPPTYSEDFSRACNDYATKHSIAAEQLDKQHATPLPLSRTGLSLASIEALDSLLRIWYSLNPELDSTDIDVSITHAEHLLQHARQMKTLGLIRPHVSANLLAYGRGLYQAIARDPVRMVKLSLILASPLIYREGIIHLVGTFPSWKSSVVELQELGQETHSLITRKYSDLEALRLKIERTLFLSSIRCNGKDVFLDRNNPETRNTWFVVQVWRDWYTRSYAAAIYNKDNSTEARITNMYRTMAKGGNAYLPTSDVVALLKSYRFGDGKTVRIDEGEVERDLELLKGHAMKTVKGLCENKSLLDVEGEGVGYFTCMGVEVEEMPSFEADE